MIRDLIHSNPQRNIVSNTGVLCLPRKNSKLKYIGETYRTLHVHFKEHKRDIRIGNLNNALLQHISQTNNNFDFNSSKMLIYIHNKSKTNFRRRCYFSSRFRKYSSGLL